MIQKQSLLHVMDNTSVSLVKCIGFYRGSSKGIQSVARVCLVSVQDIRPNQIKGSFRRGDLLKAVQIQTKKSFFRKSSFFCSFDFNQIVLLNSQKKPLASKIKGLVPKELRNFRSLRVASIASGLI